MTTKELKTAFKEYLRTLDDRNKEPITYYGTDRDIAKDVSNDFLKFLAARERKLAKEKK